MRTMKTTTTVTLDGARRPLRYRFEKSDPAGTLVTEGVASPDALTKTVAAFGEFLDHRPV